MKKLSLVLIFLLFANPAFAKDAPKKKTPPKPDSSAELVIPDKECRAMAAYKEAKGVEYEPGVDVHGKPVMEADTNPSVIKVPDKVSFPLTVDVAKYMGLTTPNGLEGEANMGTITVEKGEVKFNGNPLEGDAEAALKSLCAQKEVPKTKAKKPK